MAFDSGRLGESGKNFPSGSSERSTGSPSSAGSSSPQSDSAGSVDSQAAEVAKKALRQRFQQRGGIVRPGLDGMAQVSPTDHVVPEQREIMQAERALAVAVLKDPSQNAKDYVKKFYDNLSELVRVRGLDKYDFNCLLEAVPDANSEFSWKRNPDEGIRLEKLSELVTRLKEGISARELEDNFATLVFDMDTLTTAIGYTSVGKPPDRKSPLTTKVGQLLQEFKDSQYTAEHISAEQAKGRIGHMLGDKAEREDERAVRLDGIPQEGGRAGMGSRRFRAMDDEGKETFPLKAASAGIGTRSHMSGSIGLTFAATCWMHDLVQVKEGGVALTRKKGQEDLFPIGGLFVAAYSKGDFHTFAETAAGVMHFLQEHTGDRLTTDIRGDDGRISPMLIGDLSPRTCLAWAIGAFNAAKEDPGEDEYLEGVQTILDYTRSPAETDERIQRFRSGFQEGGSDNSG